MKTRLARGDAWVQVECSGHTLFIERSAGQYERRACFDDATAAAAHDEAVNALLAEGWVETADSVARKTAAEALLARRREQTARHVALCEAPAPAEALRRFVADALPAGAQLDELLSWVEALDTPVEGGFVVRLRGGRHLEWSADLATPLTALWLSSSDSAEHAVYFGPDAGPPEPPPELEGEDWFLQEWPNDRFWFTADDSVRSYELDGGLSGPREMTPGAVLLEVLLAHLSG